MTIGILFFATSTMLEVNLPPVEFQLFERSHGYLDHAPAEKLFRQLGESTEVARSASSATAENKRNNKKADDDAVT